MKDIALHSPDLTTPCPWSVSLVFDASTSMAGDPNLVVRQAGKEIVRMMDGSVDEAAVLWFNEDLRSVLGMSKDRTALWDAIDAVPASGGSAVFDAVYAGVGEAIHGSNRCRSVIVVYDGDDENSLRTAEEIIALANKNHIRIFFVQLGSGLDSEVFELISARTGGRYYMTTSLGQMNLVYNEIANIIRGDYFECSVSYTQSIADGAEHEVEVQLVGVCTPEGVASSFKTYMAPASTSVSNGRYAADMEFQLYPNPASDLLTIAVTLEHPSASVITIRDLLGRELRRISSADARLSFTERIDLRDLQPGMYFVQLQAGGVVRTQRVVVKH